MKLRHGKMGLLPLVFLAFALFMLVSPIQSAHAVGGNTYFTNATTVGSCSTLCKGLTTTSGTLSTATVVSSFVEAAAPALDSGASSDKTGTWSAGSTISVSSWATGQTPDTVLVYVYTSKTTTPCQNAPSAITGVTWDASERQKIAGSAAFCLSEWVGHTSQTISSTTVTCNLPATPTWGICEVIAINGAEDPSGTWSPFDKSATTGIPCDGQRNSGASTAAPTTATTPSCTSGQITTVNANDLWIGMSGASVTTTQTAGNLGGVAATFVHTTTSTGGLSFERRASSATVSATVAGTFGTALSRWDIIVDVLQAAPTFFKVEPETSASLTGTPSTAANGFSGTGWVLNTAGITSGLTTILAGTWVSDTKMAIGSTTGSPKVWYWWEFWDCTTNSCTTATNIGKDWDTSTAIATSTSQTAFTITSASISAYTFPSTHFLGIEVWAALQYSGTTTSTTLTYSTIASATTDFKPSAYGYAESGTVAITEGASKMQYDAVIAGQAEEIGLYTVGAATAFTIKAAAAITIMITAAENFQWHQALAISVTITMTSLVTATQTSTGDTITLSHASTFKPGISITVNADPDGFWTSGILTCTLEDPGGTTCSVAGAASITISVAENNNFQWHDNFPVSITISVTQKKAFADSLTASITINAAFTCSHNGGPNGANCANQQYTESLTVHITISVSESGKWTSTAQGVFGNMVCTLPGGSSASCTEALTGSITLNADPDGFWTTTGMTCTLEDPGSSSCSVTSTSASVGIVVSAAEKYQYFRTETASVTLNADADGSVTGSGGALTCTLEDPGSSSCAFAGTASITLNVGNAEKYQYFRTETASITLNADADGSVTGSGGALTCTLEDPGSSSCAFAGTVSITLNIANSEHYQYFRTETASITLNVGNAEQYQYFRTETASITLNVARQSGFAASLTGNLQISVANSEAYQYFRTETVSITLNVANAHTLETYRYLTINIDLSVSMTKNYGVVRTFTGSIGVTESMAGRHTIPPVVNGKETIYQHCDFTDQSSTVNCFINIVEDPDVNGRLSVACSIGNIEQCIFGGGNSKLAQAAIAIAIVAIVLIGVLLWKTGALSMGGRRRKNSRFIR